MALGMAYNGSAGTTRDAFVNTLHFIGMDEIAINESYKNINDILSKLDNSVKFGLANSIWYRQGWTFEQNFIDINKKYFYAEVSALDFSDPLAPGIINNWVESKTNGKIKKLLDKISESTVMYLINTIYFNAPWKFKFDKNKTRTELFYNSNKIAINCNMMNSFGGYDQYTDETVTALSLPYGNGSFRMLLLQPQGVNIDEYIAQLDYTKFAEINAALKKININISVPRFKMEFEDKLNDYLANLGLSIAFMPGAADFSNMYKGPESLFISEVKHKSYVDVNEEGTEAAAATSIGIDLTSTPNSFKFNSPFVFIIHDTKTNTVMFIGKMEKPE
jgi:serpin B